MSSSLKTSRSFLSKASAPAVVLRLLCIVLVLLSSSAAFAADHLQEDETEVWLVTYGPGEIYWQRFGHNAIWIRDPGLGLDHVFNFGFFDFEQQDFFLRFLQGRMLYFSAARPAREEFAGYINEDRSIRAQRLDLSPQQELRLIEYLLEEVKPENRNYLYDYYANNCSTRVRDAINLALGGILEAEFQGISAPQTWRDHTRRLTHSDFWLYLGLEIGLGAPVDSSISRWDEMFIPSKLAEAVDSVEYTGSGLAKPLVLEDVLLYESSLDSPPSSPHAWWPGYLLASLAVVFMAWLLCRFVFPGLAPVLSRSWLTLAGLVGLVLVFLWVGTDHSVASPNLNLLVFSPLWIVLAFWKGHEKIALQIIAGLSVLALLMTLLPPGQYNLDVLAAFLPVNLAAALGLFRSRFPSADLPGVPASADR
jgi:hypothetical protein